MPEENQTAENQTALQEPAAETAPAAAEGASTEPYQYNIKVEDTGPATKKISVDVPADHIAVKLAEQFKDLRKQAMIPGFRAGHAPQKLVERKFASDVRDQVCRTLVSESYDQAIKKYSLQVVGEPEFDDAENLKLPETGDFHYTVSVEVQPQILLPPLTGLRVKRPHVEITDENINQAMDNLRQQYGGALVPVEEDRGVQSGDYIIADVHVKDGETVVAHEHDAQLVARRGRINHIDIEDLGEKLAGAKPGEKRSFKVTVPEFHPSESIRNKEVEIEIDVKDLKKLELPEVNKEFLDALGFDTVEELRQALRERMEEQIKYDIQQDMRNQINNYLLQNVHIDLPSKLSDRQADRVIGRRAVDLMMRGLPPEQVEAQIETLRTGARDEAVRELKLYFILQRVAAEQGVDVTEAELNGRIALLASQRGERPERMKQEMAKDGRLSSLYLQMREQKALDKVLETAVIEDLAPQKA